MYTLPAHAPIELPRVYPIADSATLASRGIAVTEFVEALLEGGARIVQFRHKEQFTRAVFETARTTADLCARAGARLVVNDRADVALMVGAGVHVGQEDLAPADARKVVGSAILGFSTHNRAQLLAAASEPADYLALGPVFATASKLNPDPAVGIEGLRALRPLVSKPLVAIGGITRGCAADVLAAGADSIAVIGDLLPDEPSRSSIRARMEEWLRATRT